MMLKASAFQDHVTLGLAIKHEPPAWQAVTKLFQLSDPQAEQLGLCTAPIPASFDSTQVPCDSFCLLSSDVDSSKTWSRQQVIQ